MKTGSIAFPTMIKGARRPVVKSYNFAIYFISKPELRRNPRLMQLADQIGRICASLQLYFE